MTSKTSFFFSLKFRSQKEIPDQFAGRTLNYGLSRQKSQQTNQEYYLSTERAILLRTYAHNPGDSSTFSVGNSGAPMSPKGTHLNSRRCNLRWTDLTITTLKGPGQIIPEFHGLHPRLFMVQPAGLNSSTSKPIENVEEPTRNS